jgi:hypothetical protein
MTEGVMPKSHQYLNRSSGVLMSLLVGACSCSTRSFFFAPGTPGRPRVYFTSALSGLAPRSEFKCGFSGGSFVNSTTMGALQFQTLGTRQTQVRPLEDIAKVKDWSGQGGPIGYRLVFRGGGKVYLYFSVANSITLANQLRRDAKG